MLGSSRNQLLIAVVLSLTALLLLAGSWRVATSRTSRPAATATLSAADLQTEINRYYAAGIAHEQQGEWQQAVENLRKAKELDGGKTPEIDAALARVQAALANTPGSPTASSTGATAINAPARSAPTATTAGRTASPTANSSPVVAARGTPATSAPAGQALTTEQVAADYALVRQALQGRDPNTTLYAVAGVVTRGELTVETQFLLISGDGGKIYSYQVTGRERAVAERPGSPEAITPDATFTPYDSPPWLKDSAWASYLDEGVAQLARGGWTTPDKITRQTIIGRTGIDADWELVYAVGAKQYHFEVSRGRLTFVKVADPAIPDQLP